MQDCLNRECGLRNQIAKVQIPALHSPPMQLWEIYLTPFSQTWAFGNICCPESWRTNECQPHKTLSSDPTQKYAGNLRSCWLTFLRRFSWGNETWQKQTASRGRVQRQGMGVNSCIWTVQGPTFAMIYTELDTLAFSVERMKHQELSVAIITSVPMTMSVWYLP